MPNPWLILTVLIVWAGSLFFVGRWQNEAGQTSETVLWQATQNKELAEANAQILKLNNDARATEQKHAIELAAVAAEDEKENADVINKKDGLIAKLRAGTVQLRDPYATSCVQTGTSGASPATASAGGSDGAATGQLSEQFAEFLVNQDTRADQVVVELQACQKVVASDRKLPADTQANPL